MATRIGLLSSVLFCPSLCAGLIVKMRTRSNTVATIPWSVNYPDNNYLSVNYPDEKYQVETKTQLQE